MLDKRKHPKTGKSVWALISSGGRVLKYFGAKKPSKAAFLSEERRVQFFENAAKSSGPLRKKVRKKSLLPKKKKLNN